MDETDLTLEEFEIVGQYYMGPANFAQVVTMGATVTGEFDSDLFTTREGILRQLTEGLAKRDQGHPGVMIFVGHITGGKIQVTNWTFIFK